MNYTEFVIYFIGLFNFIKNKLILKDILKDILMNNSLIFLAYFNIDIMHSNTKEI
jgi:hypothetical protein